MAVHMGVASASPRHLDPGLSPAAGTCGRRTDLTVLSPGRKQLLQGLAFSKALTGKKNRALIRHTPRKLPITGSITMVQSEPVKSTTPWRLRSKA
ncbi:hypothetical protein PCANC_09782 [Puccinia coronata f. sp. avenae]|uniref:Uncharacterized protein n=1 Tax=Puccinia coronata f. sp. avenae TaxID=200324 RepID=A0A2N5VT85_9BASI|nr:hypothetical protein PCANC_09782 [Puccinia coronata f. sp. avenae]